MSMVGGMQGYTTGGASDKLHDRIEQLERENAQTRELLLNQAKYIKTLQDENLRLNKSGKAVLRDQMRLTNERTEKCIEQEALISALLATQTELVNALDDIAINSVDDSSERTAREALEKVKK